MNKIRNEIYLVIDADRPLSPHDVLKELGDIPGVRLVSADAKATALGQASKDWPTRLVVADGRSDELFLLRKGTEVHQLSRSDAALDFPQAWDGEDLDAATAMEQLLKNHGVVIGIEAYTVDNPYFDEYEDENQVLHRVSQHSGFRLSEPAPEVDVTELAAGEHWIGLAFLTVALPAEIARELEAIETAQPLPQ